MPKGVFERSDEHRRHISEALKGRQRTPEHNRKLALAKVGKKRSADAIRKTALANTGKKHSIPWTAESRAAQSASHKGLSSILRNRYGVSFDEQRNQKLAGNKWCHEHKGFAPTGDFAGGLGYCKECAPAYNRNQLLRHTFRVDGEWYIAKLAEQGGGCAICGATKPSRSGHTYLPIDHDHHTGAVRGILCQLCNMSIARFENLPGWAELATAYLARYASPSEGSVNA